MILLGMIFESCRIHVEHTEMRIVFCFDYYCGNGVTECPNAEAYSCSGARALV